MKRNKSFKPVIAMILALALVFTSAIPASFAGTASASAVKYSAKQLTAKKGAEKALTALNKGFSRVDSNGNFVVNYMPSDTFSKLVKSADVKVKAALKLKVKASAIKNYKNLAKGKKKVVTLKGAEAAAAATKALIVALPKVAAVTPQDIDKVKAAKAAYDKNSLFQKALIKLTASDEVVNYGELLKHFKLDAAPEAAKFEVTEAKAINASQVQVTFNKDIDKLTGSDVKNYKIVLFDANKTEVALKTSGAGANVDKIDVDKNMATITFSDNITNNLNIAESDPFNLTVSNVKSAELTPEVAETKTITVYGIKDEVSPKLESVAATAQANTKKVVLKFSEPVEWINASTLVTVAGKNAAFDSNFGNEVTVVTQDPLALGSSYEVVVSNIVDRSVKANKIDPNPTKMNVTVVNDAVAPKIIELQGINERSFSVTFDKKMDDKTVVPYFMSRINMTTEHDITLTRTAVTNGGTKFTFTVGEAAQILHKLTNGGTDAQSDAPKTYTIKIDFPTSIKDAAGNSIVPEQRLVTLTQDKVQPKVLSAKYTRPGIATTGVTAAVNKGGVLAVGFDEAIGAEFFNIVKAGEFKLIAESGFADKTGLIKAGLEGGTVVSTADNTLVIKLADDTVVLPAGTYSLSVPSQLVKDASFKVNANMNAQGVVKLVVDQGTVAVDKTAPRIVNLVATPDTTGAHSHDPRIDGNVFTFTVTDNEGFDPNALKDVALYTVAGKKIDTVYNNVDIVVVATPGFPAERSSDVTVTVGPSHSSDVTYLSNFVVNGVKDRQDNYATSASVQIGTVKPLYDPASYVSATFDPATKKLTVKFSAELDPATSTPAKMINDAFTVDGIGGAEMAINAVNYTVAAAVVDKDGVHFTGLVPTGSIAYSTEATDGEGKIWINSDATKAYDATTDTLLTDTATYAQIKELCGVDPVPAGIVVATDVANKDATLALLIKAGLVKVTVAKPGDITDKQGNNGVTGVTTQTVK